MIEVALVSTPELFTKNSQIRKNPSVSSKNTGAKRSLRKFIETLDFKHKTAVRRFSAANKKFKVIKKGNVLWSNT